MLIYPNPLLTKSRPIISPFVPIIGFAKAPLPPPPKIDTVGAPHCTGRISLRQEDNADVTNPRGLNEFNADSALPKTVPAALVEANTLCFALSAI